MAEKKVYFPGLNGIRAIAAMIVLIFHIDQYIEQYFGISSIGFHKNSMAGYGVVMFFVLSGYLITHLLLLEKTKYQKINFKKFYIRRILRIWPLYYLVISIAILLYIFNAPLIDYPPGMELTTFLLYAMFLPNVGFGLQLGITTITPLWSVGVEEQFYAFWPILISKSRNILLALFAVVAVYLALKFSFRLFENGPIFNIIKFSCFDSMAIGGIGAYFVYTKSKYLKIIYHPLIQLSAWLLLLYSIVIKPFIFIGFLNNEFHSLVYLILIINVSANEKTIISLENRVFDFIGKISYGLYVYHVSVIVAISYLSRNLLKYRFENTLQDNLIIYVSIIASSIIIAYLSFHFFEAYFLKLKDKFTVVKSSAQMPAAD